MAITDNLRMMVKVCRLYYEENLSQKEISALMGISRPADQPDADLRAVAKHRHDQDQQPLRGRDQPGPRAGRALPLKDALVLDTRDGSPETFGRMAAEYLDAYIADGSASAS